MTTVTIVRVNNSDPTTTGNRFFLKINGAEMGEITEKVATKFIDKYPHVNPRHSINMLPSFSTWHYTNP